MADLYVMQTEHGLIKIGRSSDSALRIHGLKKKYHCEFSIVLILAGRADDEEDIQLALGTHRMSDWSKEWFWGTPEAEAAISGLLGQSLIWPHKYDEAKAREWLEGFEDIQADGSIRASRRRVLRILKGAEIGSGLFNRMTSGDRSLDADIWIEIDGRSVPIVGKDGVYYDDHSEKPPKKVKIPPYTSDWEAAWSLWDDPDIEPNAQWYWLKHSGQSCNPISCCIAALGVRWGIDYERLKPATGR